MCLRPLPPTVLASALLSCLPRNCPPVLPLTLQIYAVALYADAAAAKGAAGRHAADATAAATALQGGGFTQALQVGRWAAHINVVASIRDLKQCC